MTLANTQLALHAFPPQPGAQRIRLLQGDAGVVVILARLGEKSASPYQPSPTAFDSIGAAGPAKPTRLYTIEQLLPGSPDWDVTLGAAGKPVLALNKFGGAINSLSVHDGARQLPLTPLREVDDLHDPRFVRGPRGAGAVTALADDRQVLLFQRGKDGQYGAARVIAEGKQLDNALLLDTPSGWVLLTRRAELGVQRGRFPGVLEARPLGSDFKPAGAAVPVFGAERIFHFDADVTEAGYAVVAVTAAGFALARVGKDQPARIEHHPHQALSGPASMVATGGMLYLGFLTPDQKIWLTKTAV